MDVEGLAGPFAFVTGEVGVGAVGRASYRQFSEVSVRAGAVSHVHVLLLALLLLGQPLKMLAASTAARVRNCQAPRWLLCGKVAKWSKGGPGSSWRFISTPNRKAMASVLTASREWERGVVGPQGEMEWCTETAKPRFLM